MRLPTIRWELISCAFHGHFLVGTDARSIREQHATFVRESDGLRLYRCLRCSSWVLRRPPARPSRDFPPDKAAIDLPIRGRLLRDRYVLRLIAIDRSVHVLILAAVAILIFLFASHQEGLRMIYLQILQGFQGVNSGVTFSHELVDTLGRLQGFFTFKPVHIVEVGVMVTVFACIEALEMIGLWQGKRWAEYLTFVATVAFIPYEIFELSHGITLIKAGAFLINVAIAFYLLYAKRLFGINGGAKGEAREERDDSGWAYLERTSPKAR